MPTRMYGSVQRAPGLYGALQAARYASGVAGRGDTHRTPAPHTRTTTSTSCSCSATVKKTVFLTVKRVPATEAESEKMDL